MSVNNDHPDQGWSAAFDGEDDPQALRFLLKRAESDAELARRWSRWALAGDLLARRTASPAPADFADRIAARIAAEAVRPEAVTPEASQSGATTIGQGPRNWLGGAIGLAIAASVAWAALTLYVGPQEQPASSPLVHNAALPSPPAMTPVATVQGSGMAAVQQVSALSGATPVSYVPFRGRDAYMVRHSLGAQLAPLGVFSTADFLAEPLPSSVTGESQDDAEQGR